MAVWLRVAIRGFLDNETNIGRVCPTAPFRIPVSSPLTNAGAAGKGAFDGEIRAICIAKTYAVTKPESAQKRRQHDEIGTLMR
jgi:hypothetical protein